jgi:hypothetical protein
LFVRLYPPFIEDKAGTWFPLSKKQFKQLILIKKRTTQLMIL